MEKYFGYSLKNIPSPYEKTHKLKLREKIELFVKNIRWKTIFFINRDRKKSINRAIKHIEHVPTRKRGI